MRTGFGSWATVTALALIEGLAINTPAMAQTPKPAPTPAPTEGPTAESVAAAQASVTTTTPMPVPDQLSQVHPGGLTNEMVGARAAATSYTAAANAAALRSAAARVDAAWAGFLPRLSGTAQYERLSFFTLPPINFGGAVINTAQVFPLILDNYLLQASIAIPISDYFLRLSQTYSAATHSEDAARFDVVAARATSAADGRVTFYSWLRVRGAVIVAVQALNDQREHLKLARNQFDAGQASKADVLRAETGAASAELQVERAKNLADLTEMQVRIAMHVKDDEALVPGEDLAMPVTPLVGNLRALIDEAHASRLEIKSIDANAASAREQAKAAFSTEVPNLSAFGDGIEANPNPRNFPPAPVWKGTWDLGARLTWSPNDILIGGASVKDFEARAAQLEAQKGTIRDNVQLEVTQAWQAVREADFAIDSSQRELASATEAYRVAKELFNNGRATSTTLTDAETELTRSRLDLLNARADARTARVRLEHSLGRDVKMSRGSP